MHLDTASSITPTDWNRGFLRSSDDLDIPSNVESIEQFHDRLDTEKTVTFIWVYEGYFRLEDVRHEQLLFSLGHDPTLDAESDDVPALYNLVFCPALIQSLMQAGYRVLHSPISRLN